MTEKNIHFFNSITVQVPKDRVYNRLGYTAGKTKLTAQQKDEFESYINDALFLAKPKGSALRLLVEKKDKKNIVVKGGFSFNSELLSSFIKDAKEVLFMGATAGADVIKVIQDKKEDNLTKKVVFDAVASEVANLSLGWIQEYFNRELKREKKQITPNRISCGYGDFALESQKKIYDMLDLKKIGVSITENFILIPEKSVTAVCGICEVK